jgi:hypothetical protein
MQFNAVIDVLDNGRRSSSHRSSSSSSRSSTRSPTAKKKRAQAYGEFHDLSTRSRSPTPMSGLDDDSPSPANSDDPKEVGEHEVDDNESISPVNLIANNNESSEGKHRHHIDVTV